MEMAEFILLIKEDKALVNRYKKNLKECASIFTSANANKYLDNFNFIGIHVRFGDFPIISKSGGQCNKVYSK